MKFLPTAILLFGSLLSCRELVQDNFADFEQVPVVNSILIANQKLTMHLSWAGKIDTTKLNIIEGATITLFENGNILETLGYSADGIYMTDSILKPQNNYYFEAHLPGYPIISGNENLPKPASLVNIRHIKEAGKNAEGVIYPALTFTIENNPQKRQYFEVVIHLLPRGRKHVAGLEKITDPLILDEGLPIALFSNELMEGAEYEMTLNYTTNMGDGKGMTLFPLILELRSISYDYYQFVRKVYLYEQGRYPDVFDVPVGQGLFSNIQSGYGIFAGYSMCKSDTIFPN